MKAFWAKLDSMVTDPLAPGKWSSNRWLSLLCGLAGIVFAFVHPDKFDMALVLLGAAGLTMFSRTKAT